MAADKWKAQPRPGAPLGAHAAEGGVSFGLFSRNATHVWLAIFDGPTTEAAAEFALDPKEHRRGDLWGVFIEGLEAGCCYAYRAAGPSRKQWPHAFDAGHYLLDPYARAVCGDPAQGALRGIVLAAQAPAQRLAAPLEPSQRIVYECHVKGMTADPSSGVANPGVYSALIEKLPHLKELGVTTVELLPVHHCGERTLSNHVDPESRSPLTNFWGYQPIAYFAPDAYYAEQPQGGQVEEFGALVEACHAEGLEVFVDVVYNHTAEGGPDAPPLALRGLDNSIYYHCGAKGQYRDYSGCGNSVSANHPVVQDLILDSLRYWHEMLGVDGFRFDLASILNRDRAGNLHGTACVVDRIAEDPRLRSAHLTAEPWDLGGAYQVGAFDGARWTEWNGRYRDDVRRYWLSGENAKADFAKRLTGSPDVYQAAGSSPLSSVNFLTAHDGFTLRDLVSYNKKHNEKNGEENRDGNNHNISWNCGVEGPSDDPLVEMLRLRLQKSLLATLFCSLGTPMLLAGDEFGRSQEGNNNAWCQDNPIGWIDWTLAEKNAELLRFVKAVIAFRKQHEALRRTVFFTGKPAAGSKEPDLAWYSTEGGALDWQSGDKALAVRIDGAMNAGKALYLMFNPTRDSRPFAMPPGRWCMCIDTARQAPYDAPEPGDARFFEAHQPFYLGQKGFAAAVAAED